MTLLLHSTVFIDLHILTFHAPKVLDLLFTSPVPQDRRAGRKVCDLLTISSEDTRAEKVEGISL